MGFCFGVETLEINTPVESLKLMELFAQPPEA